MYQDNETCASPEVPVTDVGALDTVTAIVVVVVVVVVVVSAGAE